MVQSGVQPGDWWGERVRSGLSDCFSGPRSLSVESHPRRPQSSAASRAAQSVASGDVSPPRAQYYRPGWSRLLFFAVDRS